MTKVRIRFKFEYALDEAQFGKIRDAQAIYGIEWLKMTPAMDGLEVEYDATRLRPDQLEAALRSLGLPVERV